MLRYIYTLVLVGAFWVGNTQSLTFQDSSSSLIKNLFIQIETAEAIDAMYNFEFSKSLSHFNYIKKKYRRHPLPYLLIALNYWWRIVPDESDETYDDIFLAYLDTTLATAKQLGKINPIEGAFFLSAGYGLKARLFSERSEYRKAAVAGKAALNYLAECRGHETYSIELLFGDGLFNYYSEWVKKEYPLLRPLMLFFPSGDKEKGIAQLKEVSRNAFYTRTEAQYFLMRILSNEGTNLKEALRMSKYLHDKYPQNAYFSRFYARLLYQNGNSKSAADVSKHILDAIEHKKIGYEAHSGRYASFFLGSHFFSTGDLEKSKEYFHKTLQFSKQVDAEKMGYSLYSLMKLGEIASREQDVAISKGYYKKVKKLAKYNSQIYKNAKKALKSL